MGIPESSRYVDFVHAGLESSGVSKKRSLRRGEGSSKEAFSPDISSMQNMVQTKNLIFDFGNVKVNSIFFFESQAAEDLSHTSG